MSEHGIFVYDSDSPAELGNIPELTDVLVNSRGDLITIAMQYSELNDLEGDLSFNENFSKQHGNPNVCHFVKYNHVSSWPALATYVTRVLDIGVPVITHVWHLKEITNPSATKH